MKPILKYFFVLIGISLPLLSYGDDIKSSYPERLSLFFDNQIKMEIQTGEILKIPIGKMQDSIFSTLIENINMVQDSLSKINSPLLITYSKITGDRQLLKVSRITDTEAGFIFKGKSDTVSTSFYHYTIEFQIDAKNHLVLYTNNLSDISKLKHLSFTNLVNEAQSDISKRRIPVFKAKMCTYSVKNNILEVQSAKIDKKLNFTFLFGVGTGLSCINNNFLPTFSWEVAYVLNPKNQKRGIIGYSREVYYSTDVLYGFNNFFYQFQNPNSSLFILRDYKLVFSYLDQRSKFTDTAPTVFPTHTFRYGIEVPVNDRFKVKTYTYFGYETLDEIVIPNSLKTLFEFGITYKLL